MTIRRGQGQRAWLQSRADWGSYIRIMRISVVSGLVLLLAAFNIHAQQLSRPAEFYFDEDERTARPVTAVEGSDEPAQQRLLRMIERNERNANAAQAQLAHIAMATGRAETGRGLYDQLLASLGRGWLRNSVQWNYGWDLYRAGEVEAALEQWIAAGTGRPQSPEWVPPTFALALWQLERRDEARDWYAAAVRTWPGRWSNPDLEALLPDWSADERAVLAQVHAAWAEDPPGWP